MEYASLVRTSPGVPQFKSAMEPNYDFDDDLSDLDEEAILNDDVEIKPSDPLCFVTEDEIRSSLVKKEETDSLSLSGDCETVDNISQLSEISRNSIDDLSLNALMVRRNELINSMKSNLDTSCESVVDPFNDSNISTSTVIEKNVCENEEFKDAAVPPAAKFLKGWKPSFSHDGASEKLSTSKTENYEEAFSSLHEILSQPSNDTILDLYISKLDEYEVEDQKEIHGFLSQIDTEKKNFLSPEKSPTKELDSIIKITDSTLNAEYTAIDVSDDTNEKTVVELTKTVTAVEPQHNPEPEIEVPKEVDKIEKTPVAQIEPVVDDKDPENLIIDGDDVGGYENVDAVVEDILLASDDEQDEKAVPLPSTTQQNELKVFISNDEAENRDNEDPQWDYLRNLSNDYERYLAVRARWRNLEIPNPKKDLTCRCHRVKNGKVPMHNIRNKNGKRPHSPEPNRRNVKRPRRESCTMLFDRSVAQLIRDVERDRYLIQKEQKERLRHLADIQKMEQILAVRERKNERFLRDMNRRQYMETESLIKDYQYRLDDLRERSKQKIDALKKAAAEVREFHEFYPDQNSSNGDHNSFVYLTETEVQEILEVEDMLMRFETFYKVPSPR